MLGLAFGFTGFLMNHRTLLRIPVEKAETTRTQVSIPAAFANSAELAIWLRGRFALPRAVSARHVPGSGLVDLETQEATGWGLLMRLHTGCGASAIWVLIADTIAGALMLLTLSGVLLWTRLRLPRLAGVVVLLTAPVLTVVYLAII